MKKLLWILSSIITGILLFFATNVLLAFSSEMKAKEEWAGLQSIEYDNRITSAASPIICTQNGMSFFGIPDSDTSGPQIWILLHPYTDPFYKQMPGDVSYTISKEDYQKVQASNLASATVLAVLSSHIK